MGPMSLGQRRKPNLVIADGADTGVPEATMTPAVHSDCSETWARPAATLQAIDLGIWGQLHQKLLQAPGKGA